MNTFARTVAELFQIHLTPVQLTQFSRYEAELLDWNTRMNLTAVRTGEEIQRKHFLDSLSCVMAWRNSVTPGNLIDVGTGAGFPGLVLKIAIPELQLTLVESIGKKVNFCAHIITVLGLTQIKLIQERAEILGHNTEYREKYDCAVARAVAGLSTLTEYLLPFVKTGGIMIAQKGANADKEVTEARKAIQVLGGGNIRCQSVLLPGDSYSRQLVVVDKMQHTPPEYPREPRVLLAQPI